jgi:hypothetical protein
MRSKIDTKLQRRAKKPKSPVGGKALQRLFFYLSERDPALNNDVLATIEVPKVARPRFGLTKSAPRARRGRAARRPNRSLRRSPLPLRRFAPAALVLDAVGQKLSPLQLPEPRPCGRLLGHRSFPMDKPTAPIAWM